MNQSSGIIQLYLSSEFYPSLIKEENSFVTSLRESDVLEFKQSFMGNDQAMDKSYLKTIAAFANTKGGFIIFGIEPLTHKLVGIKNKYLDYDNKNVSETINTNLDGSFNYLFHAFIFENILLAILYIGKAHHPPIILKQQTEDSYEGSIFFRYPGMSRRILAGDLRKLLTDEIQSRIDNIFQKAKFIANSVDSNIALLNSDTGELEGISDKTRLFLDKQVLDRLNLIKEGQFVEKDGSPAYIIKGEIFNEDSAYFHKFVQKLITTNDIYNNFLSENCEYPMECIKFILTQNSPLLPFNYFVNKHNQVHSDVINEIEKLDHIDIKETTRTAILKRLKSNNSIQQTGVIYHDLHDISDYIEDLTIAGNLIRKIDRGKSEMAINRTVIFQNLVLLRSLPDFIFKKHLKLLIEAVSNLDANFVSQNGKYIKDLMKIILADIGRDANTHSLFRKTICRIDQILFPLKIKH